MYVPVTAAGQGSEHHVSCHFEHTLSLLRHIAIAHTLRSQQSTRQHDTPDLPAVEVIHHLWVQVKKDGHVHHLTPSQALLLKAEALDFVEIVGGLVGHHVVCGHTSDGMRAAGRNSSSQRVCQVLSVQPASKHKTQPAQHHHHHATLG